MQSAVAKALFSERITEYSNFRIVSVRRLSARKRIFSVRFPAVETAGYYQSSPGGDSWGLPKKPEIAWIGRHGWQRGAASAALRADLHPVEPSAGSSGTPGLRREEEDFYS